MKEGREDVGMFSESRSTDRLGQCYIEGYFGGTRHTT